MGTGNTIPLTTVGGVCGILETGAGVGTGATVGTKKSLQITQQHDSQARQSCLNLLNQLSKALSVFNDEHDTLIALINDQDLAEALAFTRERLGSLVQDATLMPSFLAVSVTQLFSDLYEVLQFLSFSLSQKNPKVMDWEGLTQTKQAFVLDREKEEKNHDSISLPNSAALSGQLKNIFQLFREVVAQGAPEGSLVNTHLCLQKATYFLSALGTGVTTGGVSALIDTVGHFFRESGGTIIATHDDSVAKNNCYHALQECSKVFLEQPSNTEQCLIKLGQVQDALLNLEEANKLASNHHVSAPVSLSFLRAVLSGVSLAITQTSASYSHASKVALL